MIVLTVEDKDWLLNFLQAYKADMLARGLAIEPIEFSNGWMLPEEVLYDPRCAKAYKKLIELGELKNMVIRDVLPEEMFGDTGRPTDAMSYRRAITSEETISKVPRIKEANSTIYTEEQLSAMPWYKRLWIKLCNFYHKLFSK